MADTRERLIELLAEHCPYKEKRCVGCDPGKHYHPECKTEQFGKVADHLIANGVFVLPCSYGKTIYAVGSNKIVECEVDEISFGIVGLMYLVNFDCDSNCDGCPFNSWKQDYSGEWSCDGEYNQACVKGCDFGKTVFLTREEAEAALAERKMDNA